jgi:tRNA A-37 threonylcarbamoyl transferase component Bud32
MDKRYEAYCLVDPAYYDHPASRADRSPDFAAVRRPVPDGWSAHGHGEWWQVTPAGDRRPGQGWKTHVSAAVSNAEKVLDETWDYCVAEGVAFKFLRGPRMHFLRNSKYADRGHSGKLLTVYPADEAELERILKQLGDRLRGEVGPYILSDLRWEQGPLYVRYGGFKQRHCLDRAGNLVTAVEDPAGVLVPDQRGPVFAPPEWVALPDFLAPQLAARSAATTADSPYRVDQALHFSNGGGVYLATDTRTGQRVVLKEARPYAGLIGDGRDAVARLERERDILRLLTGSGVAPEVRDHFTLGEHSFLALEYVGGRPLNSFFAERFPLDRRRPDPAAVAGYTEWALRILAATERAVAVIHERGIVFNDLHLFNIMVRPDDSVALIDFEVAVAEAEATRQLLGSRAFQAPADRTGFGVDRYALACLRLALFLPLTTLLPLDRGRAVQMAGTIKAQFPAVPRYYLDEAVRELVGAEQCAARAARPPLPEFGRGPDGWPQLRDALAAGIKQSATPERADRLFPGDIRQFGQSGAGLGLAHGAAGVLYALHSTGVPVEPEHVDWLLRAAADPPAGAHLGLYDGMHGVAYCLDLLGHRDAALRTLDITLHEQWQQLGSDLTDGLSGVGLNLLHFARRTGDHALLGEALTAADLIAERLGGPEDVPTTSGAGNPHAGLMRGSSGPALLFLHLYEHSGEPRWLDLADTALRQDLRRCVILDKDGSMHVDEGRRSMPYLAHGAAGIGLVLRRFLRHRPDEGFAAAGAAIRTACTSRFYAQSGLWAGRAGTILSLAGTVEAGQPAAADPETLEQVQALAWHAVAHEGALAFPGDQLFRLSSDLATGAAGVLLALGAVLHDCPTHLPFLDPELGAATIADQPDPTAEPHRPDLPEPRHAARGGGPRPPQTASPAPGARRG